MPLQGPELPPLSRAASEALGRRRRGRNVALLVALLALAALFYFISIAKLSQHGAEAPAAPVARTPT